MIGKTGNPFYGINQRIAASRPGAWFFSRVLHHLDKIVIKLSQGRTTLSTILTGLPTVVLTTTGAKSGLPRTLPFLYIRDPENPGTFILIASNWGQHKYPAWYFNLKAYPRASASVQGKESMYIAHEATEEEYPRYWQLASALYVGYEMYKQRVGTRRIPIMVLTPE